MKLPTTLHALTRLSEETAFFGSAFAQVDDAFASPYADPPWFAMPNSLLVRSSR